MEENNDVIQAINNGDWTSVYRTIRDSRNAGRDVESNLLMQILDRNYQQPEQKEIASRAAVSLLNAINIDVNIINNDNKTLLELAIEKNIQQRL